MVVGSSPTTPTKNLSIGSDFIEIWKDIPGYEGYYKISDIGNVMMFYHNHWVEKSQYKTSCGYMYVTLRSNGKRKNCGVHRLVAEVFVDGYFDGAEVNHKDLDKCNNCCENLEWVTHSENQKHQYKKYHPLYEKNKCESCGKEISKGAKYCTKCRGKYVRNWPKYEELFNDLLNMNFSQIGRKYNKSDKGIRKICVAYNLPSNTKELEEFRKNNK